MDTQVLDSQGILRGLLAGARPRGSIRSMNKTPSTKAVPTKSWTARLQTPTSPKRVRLDKDFAGIKSGTMLFVGTPPIIDAYLRQVPPGETRTIERMRRELARTHQCDATCPVSTAIFLRIAAEAAIEGMEAGQALAEVSPFWRVIAPDSTIARKLPLDPDWIAHQRALEQA